MTTLLQLKEHQFEGLNAGEGGSSPAPVLLSGDLGGMTLAPGKYRIQSALIIEQGNLTLDACGDVNATWTFETEFITTTSGAGGSVVLQGGASSKNIVWRIGRADNTTPARVADLSQGLPAHKVNASMLVDRAQGCFGMRSLAFFKI